VATAELCATTDAGRVLPSLDPDRWSAAVRELLDAGQNEPVDLHGQVIGRWNTLLRSL
jgi:hypothetical protein